VDPSGLSEEQLKEIPYTKIEYVFENLVTNVLLLVREQFILALQLCSMQ
jgi:hypothetical protein